MTTITDKNSEQNRITETWAGAYDILGQKSVYVN